uniref:Holliday junction resolvase RuvC n=1 Tax=viral metagenome TaxID=1070528 RepID=A0A6C0CKV4_9ZZZZ
MTETTPNYNVLVLDPATTTGYCIMQINPETKRGEIIKYGSVEADQSLPSPQSPYVKCAEQSGRLLVDLENKVKDIIEKYSIVLIGIEDYFFSSKTCTGSSMNAHYRAVLHCLANRMNIPYVVLNISLWKKFVTGLKKPTKDQVKKWGKAPSQKIFIQDALWKKYKFRFPNWQTSKKSGKPIKFKHDAIDSVGMAVYFGRIHLNLDSVTLGVVPPPDNPKIKSVYVYDDA